MWELLIVTIGTILIFIAGVLLAVKIIENIIKQQGPKTIDINLHTTEGKHLSLQTSQTKEEIVNPKKLIKLALQDKPEQINIKTNTAILDEKSN